MKREAWGVGVGVCVGVCVCVRVCSNVCGRVCAIMCRVWVLWAGGAGPVAVWQMGEDDVLLAACS